MLGIWVPSIGRALGIAETSWADLMHDMDQSVRRWIRHVADPEDSETYLVLRLHASRGFISKFPPSRFLAGQMRLFELFAAAVRARHRRDRGRRTELLSLFSQEFEERILHITDFFVEAREGQLLSDAGSELPAVDRQRAGGDV